MHLTKIALFQSCLQLVFAELIKHLSEVSLVLILIVLIHQFIIEIHQHEPVNIPMHHGIHQTLEDTGGITQPQWQNSALKQAILCNKGSLFTATRRRTHLVIAKSIAVRHVACDSLSKRSSILDTW